MQKARILQSGFLAWASVDLVRNSGEEVSFKASIYTPDYQVADTENYYDKNVEFLFQQWRNDNSLMNRFEFREAVLLLAMRVFHEKSILPWVQLQLNHASLSYLHHKFLSEMFASAMLNKAKTLDNFQYYRMLQPQLSAPTAASKRPIEGFLKDMLDFSNGMSSKTNLVSKILAEWTEDIHGMCDLLESLHVIFGKRSGVASVANKTV